MQVGLNAIEEEIVFLKAIRELIDSMVNAEMLEIGGMDPDCQIRFHSITHQRFFNAILVDFLSCTDVKAPVKKGSYMAALESIARTPSFNVDNSVGLLKTTTREFADWLRQEVAVSVWLPSLDVNTSVCLARVTFLKMSGNICKHNFLRSCGVANELVQALAASGVAVEMDDALLALGDFYGRFHTDIFNYHSSTIVEFLNDIRWGIYEYLRPEFLRSFVQEDVNSLLYRYTYPAGVTTGFAKACYWELMNDVLSAPYAPRFRVTRFLKLRY